MIQGCMTIGCGKFEMVSFAICCVQAIIEIIAVIAADVPGALFFGI